MASGVADSGVVGVFITWREQSFPFLDPRSIHKVMTVRMATKETGAEAEGVRTARGFLHQAIVVVIKARAFGTAHREVWQRPPRIGCGRPVGFRCYILVQHTCDLTELAARPKAEPVSHRRPTA